MPDPANRRIPWPRIFAEGVVIVASILLALAADAWWDQREDQRAERDALARLGDEFTAVDSVLREWQANHDRVRQAGEVLLANSGPASSTSMSADSISRLLGTFNFVWTVSPPSGVLSSLVASGQLGLIRNENLRTALAAWQSLLDDLQSDEAFALDVVADRLVPLLQPSVSLSTIVILGEDYPQMRRRFENDFGTLLTDREFEGLVAYRIQNIHWILRSYAEALEGVADIRSMIDAELES